MSFTETFLSAYWPALEGCLIGWSLAWYVKRSITGMAMPFLDPKSFPELSSFPEVEQKRLVNEAIKEALGPWRWFMEFVFFPVIFSFATVFGAMLVRVNDPTGSMWIRSCFAGAFGGLAFWALIRLIVRFLKPYVARHIGRIQSAG